MASSVGSHTRPMGTQDWNWMSISGRVLLAFLFLLSGLLKLAFHDPIAGAIASKGLPAADTIAWAVALFEVAAAVLLAFGVRLRETAIALALWCLVTGLMFHRFWAVQDPAAQQAELFNFLKNVALFGALLIVARVGSRRDHAASSE